jgi:hypothetical protein
MMTNNPELMDFILENMQDLMDATPAYPAGMNTQH